MRTGGIWHPRQADGDELVRAWEYMRKKYGADRLTGKVYSRNLLIDGVIEEPNIPANVWLFELGPQRVS